MPTQLQLRRGTTAQTASFTGATGEVTVDTDRKTLVVHDGSTTGGTPLSTQAFTQSSFDSANTVSVRVDEIPSPFLFLR
jgi:hypothetical protein